RETFHRVCAQVDARVRERLDVRPEQRGGVEEGRCLRRLRASWYDGVGQVRGSGGAAETDAEGNELAEGAHAEPQQLPAPDRDRAGGACTMRHRDLDHIVAPLPHEDGEEKRGGEGARGDRRFGRDPRRPPDDLEGHVGVGESHPEAEAQRGAYHPGEHETEPRVVARETYAERAVTAARGLPESIERGEGNLAVAVQQEDEVTRRAREAGAQGAARRAASAPPVRTSRPNGPRSALPGNGR